MKVQKAVQGITALIQTMQQNVEVVVKQMNEQVALLQRKLIEFLKQRQQ